MAKEGTKKDEAAEGGDDRAKREQPQEISKWEWVAGAIGLVLLLALVGFLAREAMTGRTPPDLVARVDSVTHPSSGWVAHVRLRNAGRETAVSVTVEGELAMPAGDTLRSETTLDYVPGHSERRGALLFDRDPRSGTLTVRATGYQEP